MTPSLKFTTVFLAALLLSFAIVFSSAAAASDPDMLSSFFSKAKSIVNEFTSGFSLTGYQVSTSTKVTDEHQAITRNDYFAVIAPGGKSYTFRYISATSSLETSPSIQLQDISSGSNFNVDYMAKSGDVGVGDADAILAYADGSFKIWNASDDKQINFYLRIDLNGDGKLEGAEVVKPSPCPPFGDVNGDGVVSKSGDSELIQNYMVGNTQLTDSQLKAADVTADGKVNVGDALFISQYLIGVRTTFTACPTTPSAITDELQTIGKNDYFTIKTPSGNPYNFRYVTGLKSTELSPTIELQEVTTGSSIVLDYKTMPGDAGIGDADTILNYAGSSFKIWNASDDKQINFYLRIDLNGDGKLEGASPLEIVKPSPCPPNGDVNGDGSISNDDATLIQKYLAHLVQLTDAQQKAADVTADGKVTINDVTLIQQFLNGKHPTLPSCTTSIDDQTIPSCKTLSTVDYIAADGTGYIGCDIVVTGSFNLAKSYCIGQKTGKHENLIVDSYGRPNRYYATLTGLDPTEEVKVFVVAKNGKEVECLPSLNTAAGTTPTVTTASCTDSDGGLNYFIKGTAKSNVAAEDKCAIIDNSGGSSVVKNVESCSRLIGSSGSNCGLSEAYCLGGKNPSYYVPPDNEAAIVGQPFVTCIDGCSNGACLKNSGNTGYTGASWSCYGGTSGSMADNSDNPVCYSNQELRQIAEDACKGHCSTATQKCGVNSFSASGSCQLGQTCTDTDGGLNYYVKGTAKDSDSRNGFEDKCAIYNDATGTFTYVSGCMGSTVNEDCGLSEAYCDKSQTASWYVPSGNGIGPVFVPCPNGCSDGACIAQTSVCGNGICENDEASVCPVCKPGQTTCPKYPCQEGTCPQDCSATSVPPPEPPPVVTQEFKIAKGWNLVGAVPLIATEHEKYATSTCSWLQGGQSSGNVGQTATTPATATKTVEVYLKKNMYSYDPVQNKYTSLGELGSFQTPADGGYLMHSYFNGFWLRSTEDCTITLTLPADVKLNILDTIVQHGLKLDKGWNFLSVWPDLTGKTLNDNKGTCDLSKAYGYDAANRQWINLNGIELSKDATWSGFVVKAADDCVLGTSTELPPPLPTDAAQTATASAITPTAVVHAATTQTATTATAITTSR